MDNLNEWVIAAICITGFLLITK